MWSDLRRLLTYLGILRRVPQTKPIEPFERWRDYRPGTGVQIFRPVVYTLEQHVLPQAFFQNHPAIARAALGRSRISKELSDLWFHSFRLCAGAGSVPAEPGLDSLPVLRYLADLGAATTFTTRQGAGVVAHIVIPPEPVKSGEAVFIALCMAGTGAGEVRRCFTLEKSTEQDVVFFCELAKDGSRANLGPTATMSLDEFARTSLARMPALGA